MALEELKRWVYSELRVDLTSYKETQLDRRINSLMRRRGVNDESEYIGKLRESEKEQQILLEHITINVSEFFRNPNLFNELKNVINESLLSRYKNIKIWSAACSIGAEPYSLSMIMKDFGPSIKYSITATDIDAKVMDYAKRAIYTEKEVATMPKYYRDKYTQEALGGYKILEDISENVNYERFDLILGNYNNKNGYHLVVCRNVLIYFKDDTKKKVFRNLADSLVEGGLLFVGATETIMEYKEYGLEKISTFIYRKL